MSHHQTNSDSLERLMLRFYEHQADLLKVHEQYLHHQQETSSKFLQLVQQHYAGGQVNELNLRVAEADQSNQPNQQTTTISTTIPTQPSVDLPVISETVSQPLSQSVTQVVITDIPPQSSMVASMNTVALMNDAVHPETIVMTSSAATDASRDSWNLIAQSQQAPATVNVSAVETALLAVVSDKTGYPVEMLEIGMDMEAELGIDSIKRVEILGAMQERFPDLPPVNPEALAELRTLQQVVDYMGQQAIASKKNLALV